MTSFMCRFVRFGVWGDSTLSLKVVGHHSVVTLVNWTYIFGHWPVIVATLIWLYRTRRHDYLALRMPSSCRARSAS